MWDGSRFPILLKDKNQLTRKVVPKVYPEVIKRIEIKNGSFL